MFLSMTSVHFALVSRANRTVSPPSAVSYLNTEPHHLPRSKDADLARKFARLTVQGPGRRADSWSKEGIRCSRPRSQSRSAVRRTQGRPAASLPPPPPPGAALASSSRSRDGFHPPPPARVSATRATGPAPAPADARDGALDGHGRSATAPARAGAPRSGPRRAAGDLLRAARDRARADGRRRRPATSRASRGDPRAPRGGSRRARSARGCGPAA